jgi:hypothetical protein
MLKCLYFVKRRATKESVYAVDGFEISMRSDVEYFDF